MKRQRGVVLINALMVVLVISSVAAALLAKSEAARLRAVTARDSQQLDFHLDAMEDLALILLAPAGLKGDIVHPGQEWATEPHLYQIGDGEVRGRFTDLQGRLNINWLAAPEDEYIDETFRRLFVGLGLRSGLVEEIREFMAPGGPRDLPRYLRATVPLEPRGGPIRLLDELRALRAFEPGDFETLEPYIAALPFDARLNLNTASMPVLRAALHPLPSEVQAEYLRPDRNEPIADISEMRRMTIRILETEEGVDELPFRKFTVSSQWFRADLAAILDGKTNARRVIFTRDSPTDRELVVAYRWSLRD